MSRRVVHGRVWAHLAPPTYADMMREAADNDAVREPSQPAAEHTVAESSLPREVRFLLAAHAAPLGDDAK